MVFQIMLLWERNFSLFFFLFCLNGCPHHSPARALGVNILEMWPFIPHTAYHIPASGNGTGSRWLCKTAGEWTSEAERLWKQRTILLLLVFIFPFSVLLRPRWKSGKMFAWRTPDPGSNPSLPVGLFSWSGHTSDLSLKTECGYLYGWIKKKSRTQ